jgi:hypothetical protein
VLALKIVVTPLLMLLVSLAARRWGSLVGGLLSGLPLTSAPIAIYLVAEQGPAFTARVAAGGLGGVAAGLLSYLAYVVASARAGPVLAGLAALVAFGLTSAGFLVLGMPLVATAASFAAILALAAVTAGPRKPARPRTRSAIGLPVRCATAVALVLLVTGSAPLLGPEISGVLAPLPVIAWPLALFAQIEGGRDDALAVLRGNALGGSGLLTFYLVVAGGLERFGPLATFSAAIAAALAAAAATVAVERALRGRAAA